MAEPIYRSSNELDNILYWDKTYAHEFVAPITQETIITPSTNLAIRVYGIFIDTTAGSGDITIQFAYQDKVLAKIFPLVGKGPYWLPMSVKGLQNESIEIDSTNAASEANRKIYVLVNYKEETPEWTTTTSTSTSTSSSSTSTTSTSSSSTSSSSTSTTTSSTSTSSSSTSSSSSSTSSSSSSTSSSSSSSSSTSTSSSSSSTSSSSSSTSSSSSSTSSSSSSTSTSSSSTSTTSVP